MTDHTHSPEHSNHGRVIDELLLWLDDTRPAPPGWAHAHTVDDAITLIRAATTFTAADLDHWLGPGQDTGMALLDWMRATHTWPHRLNIHTSDPTAYHQMRNHLRTHAPHLL